MSDMSLKATIGWPIDSLNNRGLCFFLYLKRITRPIGASLASKGKEELYPFLCFDCQFTKGSEEVVTYEGKALESLVNHLFSSRNIIV